VVGSGTEFGTAIPVTCAVHNMDPDGAPHIVLSPPLSPPTLAEAGIDKHLADRARKLALSAGASISAKKHPEPLGLAWVLRPGLVDVDHPDRRAFAGYRSSPGCGHRPCRHEGPAGAKMRQAARGEVCLGAGKAARFTVAVASTAGFDCFIHAGLDSRCQAGQRGPFLPENGRESGGCQLNLSRRLEW
jgi:hypothetical protein